MDVPVPASCLYRHSMQFWLQTWDAQHKCVALMLEVTNNILPTWLTLCVVALAPSFGSARLVTQMHLRARAFRQPLSAHQ